MSILNAIKHDLGIVEGILIPGASASTTILTHALQQPIADAYGAAIKAAITKLAPETGMTGPQKALAIADAVANDIVSKGVKAEVAKLRDVVLDIVQAAYRAVEPSIGSDIMAMASAFHLGPTLTVVAELVVPVIQKAADELVLDKPLAA